MKLISILFFLFTIGSGYAVAQKDKSDKNKNDEVPTELRVNLSAVDSSQNLVNDLTAADIKIFDNDVDQKVTYFAKTPSTNVAFVVDNTGSMRSQLNVEIALAKSIAANLRASDEGMVVRFVSRDKVTLQQSWTTSRDRLNNAFDNLFIEGGQSAIVDGMYLAASSMLERAKTEKDKRFAIVLITDGEDRDSYYLPKHLLSMMEGSGIQIFVLGLDRDLPQISGISTPGPREKAEKFLREMTERTGGTLYLFNKKYDLPELQAGVEALVSELRSQYVIGYSSPNKKARPKNFRVEIADGPKGQKRIATVSRAFSPSKN